MRVLSPFQSLLQRLQRAWQERRLALKALSFGLVGLVNLAVDFTVFSIGYFYFALPIVIANVIAWVLGVTNSYILNSLTTFAVESGRQLRMKDYVTFVVTQTGGLITNTATVVIASYFMPVLLAKLLAILIGFVVNFSLSHYLVFRRREPMTHD